MRKIHRCERIAEVNFRVDVKIRKRKKNVLVDTLSHFVVAKSV